MVVRMAAGGSAAVETVEGERAAVEKVEAREADLAAEAWVVGLQVA